MPPPTKSSAAPPQQPTPKSFQKLVLTVMESFHRQRPNPRLSRSTHRRSSSLGSTGNNPSRRAKMPLPTNPPSATASLPDVEELFAYLLAQLRQLQRRRLAAEKELSETEPQADALSYHLFKLDPATLLTTLSPPADGIPAPPHPHPHPAPLVPPRPKHHTTAATTTTTTLAAPLTPKDTVLATKLAAHNTALQACHAGLDTLDAQLAAHMRLFWPCLEELFELREAAAPRRRRSAAPDGEEDDAVAAAAAAAARDTDADTDASEAAEGPSRMSSRAGSPEGSGSGSGSGPAVRDSCAVRPLRKVGSQGLRPLRRISEEQLQSGMIVRARDVLNELEEEEVMWLIQGQLGRLAKANIDKLTYAIKAVRSIEKDKFF